MTGVDRILHIEQYPEAQCRECDWEHPVGRMARGEAKWHVRNTNHTVMVTTAQQDTYGPKARRVAKQT